MIDAFKVQIEKIPTFLHSLKYFLSTSTEHSTDTVKNSKINKNKYGSRASQSYNRG